MLKPVPLHPKIVTPSAPAKAASVPGFSTLFSVQPGVPVLDALEHASALLGVALEGARDLAIQGDEQQPWAVVYLLESTLALVNASVSGMMEARS
ncbi:DUF3077 domain-containing protein [Pseudomonas indica]|uniref:DUF3077 domain-containing protein n=1 Tax=Pseudomonas indica TaxID=137658 RepID=A0A1G8V617_9PSED|nr:DUF3077 domain-containing protein [Pseudomonas indica]SDJ61304.1 Protein of unknown function [Pseudomonas indica]